MYLGKMARHIFPVTGTLDPMTGTVMYILGFFVAMIMWGFGLVWFVIALATLYKSRPIPFNMGWWGFTFPLGVYAASTIQLGNEMPSEFFKVLGTVCKRFQHFMVVYCLLSLIGNRPTFSAPASSSVLLISSVSPAQIFGTAVVLLWIVVAAGTAKGAWSGKLFFAPCLANLKQHDDEKVSEKRKGADQAAEVSMRPADEVV